jgi:hypothetical protein
MGCPAGRVTAHEPIVGPTTGDDLPYWPQRVCIDGDAQPLIDYLRDWDAQFNQLDAELATDGALCLTYEDDIEQDPLVAYRKICAHIEQPPEAPEVRFTRTTAQPLAEIVTTLAAVREALAGTEFAWMAD